MFLRARKSIKRISVSTLLPPKFSNRYLPISLSLANICRKFIAGNWAIRVHISDNWLRSYGSRMATMPLSSTIIDWMIESLLSTEHCNLWNWIEKKSAIFLMQYSFKNLIPPCNTWLYFKNLWKFACVQSCLRLWDKVYHGRPWTLFGLPTIQLPIGRICIRNLY